MDEDGFGILIVVGAMIAIGALCWWAVSSENADLAAFKARCLAIPKSEAECQLLTELKSSSDGASMAAGVAIGVAAGSAGARR